VPVPDLDREQRRKALEKAAEVRRVRAELKQMIKAGEVPLDEVLAKADANEILAKTKVVDVLEAMPNYGKVKARKLMERLRISPTRRLRGLGANQRQALLDEFGDAG